MNDMAPDDIELLRRYAVRKSENAPGEVDLAARLQRETTMSVKWIAGRVQFGTSKNAHRKLHEWMNNQSHVRPLPNERTQTTHNQRLSCEIHQTDPFDDRLDGPTFQLTHI